MTKISRLENKSEERISFKSFIIRLVCKFLLLQFKKNGGKIKLPFSFHKVIVFGPQLPFFVGPKLPFILA